MRQEKGITLIALVITIIVLLILAGVTIAMLSGNTSAPEKAREAAIRDDLGAAKDAVTLKATEAISDYYDGKYVPGTKVATSLSSFANAGAAVLAKTYTSANVTIAPTAASAQTATAENVGTIVITSSKDNTYTSTGTVNQNGGISWVDHFGN